MKRYYCPECKAELTDKELLLFTKNEFKDYLMPNGSIKHLHETITKGLDVKCPFCNNVILSRDNLESLNLIKEVRKNLITKMKTEAFGPGLYNIRYSNYSRDVIIGRILTDDYEKALDVIESSIIEDIFDGEEVERMEIGFMWDVTDCEDCPTGKSGSCYDSDYCTQFITLEPVIEYTEDDLNFRLVTGEDMYFDVREK